MKIRPLPFVRLVAAVKKGKTIPVTGHEDP
jgi:hypothetical protein